MFDWVVMMPVSYKSGCPTFSLNASTNIAQLYQPLSRLFGRIQFLAVIITPWSLYAENEILIRPAFGCGVARLDPHNRAFAHMEC